MDEVLAKARRQAIIDGGVKGADFPGFIQAVLGPSLRPGKVVMDNLRLHKNAAVLAYLGQRRCRVVFIPPYSPETNPIELAFSKLEHLVWKAAATSLAALRSAFDRACEPITPRHARNYIRHAGYS